MTSPPANITPLILLKFPHSKAMTSSEGNLNLTAVYSSHRLPAAATGKNSTISATLFLLQDIQILEIVLAAIVFIALHSLRRKKNHGLTVWPVLGMLPSLVTALRTNTYECISYILCQKNGTFTFKGPWFSNLNCVVTSDPRNLEHFLKTKFLVFPKGKYFRDLVHDLLGNGIFSADDETWQQQRKTASIVFHSTMFRQLSKESVLELVHKRLLPVLDSSVKKSISIDLQDILLRLTFDNVCMIAFGVDPACLRPGLPEIPFAKAIEDATETTLFRFVTPTSVWKAMRFLNVGMERKLKESIKMVDEFAERVIRRRKKELSVYCEEERQRSDLLTVFMKLKDENGEPYSDKFLRDICVNFILAGRDTSSVALSWFFWLLHQNPQVEERILEEICRVVSQRVDCSKILLEDNDLKFRPEEIQRMDYMQAALSEALRLYPSVPVDHKEVVENDTFPDGTVLKKGTRVVYAIYAMGRMEGIWGKDCREFKPERWLRDGRFVSESAYKFAAFNGGPRLCLGKDFAYYQMKYAAASIIFRYRVTVVDGHPVVPKLALTMYMKHGLKVHLYWRETEGIHKFIKIN